LVDVTVFNLNAEADSTLLDFCREHMTSVLRRGGALAQGWYVTEPGPNNFPRLPVREGENVLVGVAVLEDRSVWQTVQEDWQRVIAPTLSQWLKTPPHSMTLTPTTRSAIHA
jgi:hypothetical protein